MAMSRVWTMAGLVGCMVGLQVPAVARTDSGASVHRTHVVRVRPVDAAGHLLPGYAVTKRSGHADCWTSSSATGTAYRCMSHNFIHDPCWVGANPAYAFCLRDAWSRHVFRLHVTHPYGDTDVGGARREPWGVALRSGRRCTVSQGASGAVHGKGISYECDKNHVLVGRVDNSGAVWRIRKASRTGRQPYRLHGWAAIHTAWFGRPSRTG